MWSMVRLHRAARSARLRDSTHRIAHPPATRANLDDHTLTSSCLVARRAEVLDDVRDQLVALGLPADRVLCVPADITKVDDLIAVREAVLEGTSQLM